MGGAQCQFRDATRRAHRVRRRKRRGQTTLTKLLARLYDPTEGRITLDGRDLREYDIASLRRAIGVIFQDFVRYDFAFDANIGVGEIDEVASYLESSEKVKNKGGANGQRQRKDTQASSASTSSEATTNDTAKLDATEIAAPASIVSAAEKSLATTLLPRLPAGYQQMLGRRFEGGVDLSGGEWQKIAIARAFMRDAEVLILDEPTAALDARAEYDVFIRFSELVRGRMAVLISHRFSTVRMADRIIVLKNGTVAEEGTHDKLVQHDGLYAELFKLQAAGYR